MEILLQRALMKDCKQIHEMQIVSFDELLEKYKDYKTNPGAESIVKIEQRMAQDCTDYYFVSLDDKNIGAIRVVRLKNSICRISPMFLLPEYQGKGYAQQVIRKTEMLYPEAKGWELDTIKQETKLCHLYEKMGYKAIGKEEDIKECMTIIYYIK